MKNLLLTILLLSTSVVFAGNSEKTALAEQYTWLCGSRTDLTTMAQMEGSVLTESDIKDISSERKYILLILKKGQEAVDGLINNRHDKTLDLAKACSAISKLQKYILKSGCIDLKTGKAVFDNQRNSGIDACQRVLSKITF